MRIGRVLTLALVVPLLAAGCTLAKISGRGTTPLLLNNPAQRIELIEHFATSKQIMFDYTGAFDVSEVLASVMQGKSADAITNLTITIKSTGGDFFVNLFTLGIANSRTFQVEGDLVRMPRGGLEDEFELVVAPNENAQLRTSLDVLAAVSPSDVLIVADRDGLRLMRRKAVALESFAARSVP